LLLSVHKRLFLTNFFFSGFAKIPKCRKQGTPARSMSFLTCETTKLLWMGETHL